jgi:hypothetical protein
MSNFLPQLVTCETILDTKVNGTSGPQTLHLVNFIRHPLHSDLRSQLVERDTLWLEPDVLRAWRMFSVDAFPSTCGIVNSVY